MKINNYITRLLDLVRVIPSISLIWLTCGFKHYDDGLCKDKEFYLLSNSQQRKLVVKLAMAKQTYWNNLQKYNIMQLYNIVWHANCEA